MKILLTVTALLVGSFAFAFVSTTPNRTSHKALQDDQQAINAHAPGFTADGKLIRPKGWRKWVYIGTPVTPNDMNDGKAAFPEFHNVYMDPESFSTWERLGVFPDGTQLVKELVSVGSKQAVSGNGYFMGDFQGLEVAVKDSVRFSDQPGGWAYFSFGHQKKYTETATMFAAADCNACHQASADNDWVFTQYYPVLREAMPKTGTSQKDEGNQSMKAADREAMESAMADMGVSADQASNDYAAQMFKWLSDGKYKGFTAESAIHPSSSFAAHGNVRVYVNEKLENSLSAGNKTHPVGSVACKELYKDDALIGWAVSFKTREDDGKGNGWYWYEILSLTDESEPVAAGHGAIACTGCHSPGNDYVRTSGIK